ncbi:unnamed protein product [Adineta steineri]|uniref:Ubiquitin-like domain-containing protein n=1 Tax=Adineta steineri TaxID=433720 RepID=A0A815RGD3_9BILA|nr:unnamed protein product [Adineta steineri]CAF4123542.1 unnamed protein product [Adineta steineri]
MSLMAPPPPRSTCFRDNCQLEEESKRLFGAIDSNDTNVLQSLSIRCDLFRQLCKVRQFFHSEWSEPQLELQTPFQRSCLLGRTSFVELMIEKGDVTQQILGCDVDIRIANSDSTFRRPMLFACQSGNPDVIRLLLKHGGSLDDWGSCTNLYAAKMFRIKEQMLCTDVSGEYNGSPVTWTNIYAIFFMIAQQNPMFEAFLTKDVANHRTDLGHTALHIACIFGSKMETINALLNAGLDPAAITQDGKYADELFNEPNTVSNYLREKRDAIVRERSQLKLEMLRSGIGFQIFVKTLTGKTITIVVKKDDSIYDLKCKVYERLGVEVDAQRFIYRGKGLTDEKLLHEYNIQANATIDLVVRVRGGCLFQDDSDQDPSNYNENTFSV